VLRAAGAACVLLNNEGVLPLAGERVARIGALARTPRYQGAGTSEVVPTRLVTIRIARRAVRKVAPRHGRAEAGGSTRGSRS